MRRLRELTKAEGFSDVAGVVAEAVRTVLHLGKALGTIKPTAGWNRLPAAATALPKAMGYQQDRTRESGQRGDARQRRL